MILRTSLLPVDPTSSGSLRADRLWYLDYRNSVSIFTGVVNPGGLIFVDTSKHDKDDSGESDEGKRCSDRGDD